MAQNFSNPGTEVVKPVKLAHIVLKTEPSKLKLMVDFYKTFLSARVVHENEFMSFLTYDAEHHRIAIIAIPTLTGPSPTASGLLHVAFTFSSLAELLLAYRQRKEGHGIEPYWCVNHGPTTSLYYRDPDGNEIETQVENFEDPEDATRFMMGKEFEENPVGTDFDPEEWIARLENGEKEEVLKKRVEIGRRGVPDI